QGCFHTGVSCGYYPPVPPGGNLCPWGVDSTRLWAFQDAPPGGGGGNPQPGNFGAIRACGGNGARGYRDCITGDNGATSGFWEEGGQVLADQETGQTGGNTATALNEKYATYG